MNLINEWGDYPYCEWDDNSPEAAEELDRYENANSPENSRRKSRGAGNKEQPLLVTGCRGIQKAEQHCCK